MAAAWLSETPALANSLRSAWGSALMALTTCENRSVAPKPAERPSLTLALTVTPAPFLGYQPSRTAPLSSFRATISYSVSISHETPTVADPPELTQTTGKGAGRLADAKGLVMA